MLLPWKAETAGIFVLRSHAGDDSLLVGVDEDVAKDTLVNHVGHRMYPGYCCQ